MNHDRAGMTFVSKHDGRLFLSGHHKLRSPEQGALDVRIRESADGLEGGFRVLRSPLRGGIERTIAGENVEDLRMGHSVEGALLDHGRNALALLARAVLKSMDYCHGHFAFPQVTGDRLAENGFRCGEIKNIIHDLKCHAQIPTITCNLLLLLWCRAPKDRAQAHA